MKIKALTLFTNNIKNQKRFYKNVLEFEQLVDTPKKIAFKVGSSVLIFQYKQDFKPSHVAFNIARNTISEALVWLKNRTEAIQYNNEFITDFSSWKAKAIYFYDADNNIIEFIEREGLSAESNTGFALDSILSIGEMAIATDNIEEVYNAIHAIKPISIFDGDFSRFCALGNDEGLFILIDKNKKKWYPTDDVAFTSDFIISGDYNFSFVDGKIKEFL